MTGSSLADVSPLATRPTTLLDLVQRVTRTTGTVGDTVERVVALLEAGQFRLCGSFAGARIDRAALTREPR